ncbi:MAG: DUF4132 domain-containing protein [Sandaracinaceae bacterium]
MSRHAEAARQAAEALDPAAAAGVRALLDAPAVDHAPREAWPEVLRDPPWARAEKKKLAPAGKVPLTPLEHPIRVDWRGEERARWRRPEGPPERWAELDEAGWRDAASRLVDGEDDYWTFALMAPRPVAVDLVRRFTDVPTFKVPDAIRAVVARLEADALPMVERWVARPWALEAALPLGSPTLARAVAEGLTKASTREVARAWLSRHAEAAAIGLVPAALGADAKARKAGIAGLSFLVREGHRARVADVATRYGDAAARALAPLLEASPLDEVPSRLPKLPAFWDPAALPPLVLATGGALPPDAVGLLGTMLAFSPPGAPYAGIRMVKEACTRESVAAFTWGLFEAWMQAGAPNESSWAFLQLGWLGDDSIPYRLVTRMKAWPGQGAAKRAEKGLDVLAEMDSDVALVLVHQLSQKGRGSLRKNAAKKLTRLAAVLGLGEAELADRLVPTLDLDADGSMRLDYGPRAFTVGFDEELLPFVLDANGARLEALPRPGKRDDPALAPAAEARFKALKKAVRTVAKTQLTRLERAMATERRWSGRDFRRWVVEHPLLVHVARRLVFGVYDGQSLVTSFRVADDRSYADPDDARVVVGDDATVGIAHPVDLSPEAIERWREVLNDYELVPPFPQLERERIAPPDGERGRVLAEALGATVAPPASPRSKTTDGSAAPSATRRCSIEWSASSARAARSGWWSARA